LCVDSVVGILYILRWINSNVNSKINLQLRSDEKSGENLFAVFANFQQLRREKYLLLMEMSLLELV